MAPSGGRRPGAGRPRKRASDRKSRIVFSCLTPAQYRALDAEARRRGLTMREIVRERLEGKP